MLDLLKCSTYRAALLVLLGCGLSACDGEVLGVGYGGGEYEQRIRVGDRLRDYVVYVPRAISPGTEVPLLLAFHGTGMSAETMMLLTWFNEQAERLGIVVAYLQADGDGWVSVGSPPVGEPTGELGFVEAVIDRLDRDLDIDRSRVYAAGFSNGGLMMQRLGCQFYDRIAAVGIVGATIAFPVIQGCLPQRHVPAMFFLGDLDTQFPWSDNLAANLGLLGAESSGQFWADLNECGPTRVDTDLPDTADDDTTVERWDWPNCPADGQVVFYHIRRGGHTWPGSPLNLGPSLGTKSRDIDASRLLGDFLVQQGLGGLQ
ncbi:MAG: PHB depolymerase family esterase [Gemmatimonadota bacterium]